nr:molecular chaperone TorD family protein [Acidobacteriota bacterium]
MELFRALAIFAEPPTADSGRVAEALCLGQQPGADQYTETFIFQLPPYASIYLGAEGMIGGEARDRISGFWRAIGETPAAEPDHLAVMLALYARLAELEAAERDAARRGGLRAARKAFFWEHLASWLFVYLTKLRSIAPRFYARWGETLMEALTSEATTLDQQERLPLHLREAPALVDPRRDGAEEFLQSLITPARSGIILTRADFVRAARELGLSLRMGERKFILKALFAQDAQGALDWLIEEADAWASRHQAIQEGVCSPVAEWWRQRAAATAALLKELKLSA